MNKSHINRFKRPARPLADLTIGVLADAFRKQGFASTELVTRWAAIAGDDVAQIAEPLKIQWPRTPDSGGNEPGTLVLRVSGPAAIEIQHMSRIILERVNRFFGWQAVDRLALRQAPLTRKKQKIRRDIDPDAVSRMAAALPQIEDEGLKQALGRLGAATGAVIKRP